MKYLALLAALLALASAQSISDLNLPNCSLLCLATAASAANCGTFDYQCQCTNKNAIRTSITPCLTQNGCSEADIQRVVTTTDKLCADLASGSSIPGITLPSPTRSVPVTGTPGPTPGAAGRVEAAAWAGAIVAAAAFAL